jgi:ribosomal protein S18 acetylase RimI-like enzyme
MDEAITIRKGVKEDEPAVFALAREFATSFPVQSSGFSAAFGQVLTSPNMYLAVGESSNALIGYILGTTHPTFYASGPVACMEEIMVAPAFRRRGVGKLLMESFEAWTARDCRLVTLATRRAAEFYKRLGYEESATYFRKLMADRRTLIL